MSSPLLTLPDNRVQSFVTEHTNALLDSDIPPTQVLRTRLLSIPRKKRQGLKDTIRQAVSSSNESVTNQALQMLSGGTVPPTVANYVKDFDRLDKNSWQSRSPVWVRLEETDKKRVSRLFEFYKYLLATGADLPAMVPDVEIAIEKPLIDEQKVKAISPDATTQPFTPVIRQVAEASKVDFSDEIRRQRFSAIVASGIKSIRVAGQLAEILQRPVESGGLGLPETTAQAVISAIAPIAKQYASGTLSLDTPKLKKPPQKPFARPKIPSAPDAPVITAANVPLVKKAAAIPVTSTKKVTPTITHTSPLPAAPPTRRQTRPRRRTIHDIKLPKSRLVGAVEELRQLDLTEFRRMDANPVNATEKIKNKIDNMGEESITKRSQGIKAWKQSATNQLYLTMGQISMSEGRTISEVMQIQKAANQLYLSEDEFRAIADLNKDLRF
ncbi:hypothetical protein ACFL04_03750 [Patescibacteria group bacterium]